MATNGRPTTQIHVTYGTLGTTASQRALNPVFIAPRYALHSYLDGYEEALLGAYSSLDNDLVNLDWPGKADTGVIDTDSAKLVMKDAYLGLNSTAITGTATANSNKVTFSNAIKKGGSGTLDTNLRGFEVAVGDKVVLTSGTFVGNKTEATVTGIGYTPGTATVGSAVKVNASQTSTAPTTTSSDTFSGSEDVTYLVTVTAKSDDYVTAKVTAIKGDYGYSETLQVGTTAVAVSTLGVKIAFVKVGTETPAFDVNVGDAWTIACTTAGIAAYDIVYVDAKFNSSSVAVKFLSKRFSNEYTEITNGFATKTTTKVSVADEVYVKLPNPLKAEDETLDDYVNCQVGYGTAYAQYRELLTEDALEIVACTSNNASEWAGIADPQNPMGMLFNAGSAVEDTFFYMVAIPEDTDAGYVKAINYAAQYEDLYAFVPWSQSTTVTNAITAAITKYSDPLIAQYKYGWIAAKTKFEKDVYTKDANGSVLLTTSVTATGTDAGKVEIASPGAVISGGVAPGDIMVVYGDYDPSTGDYIKKEYVVESITDDDTLYVKDPDAYTVARVEFKRVLDNDDFAEALAAEAKALNNKYLSLVWADGISALGFTDVNLAVLCAVEACTRAALPPHAPLSTLTPAGITIIGSHKMTDTQYDVMNAGGVFVVAPDSDGTPTNYHQITTVTDGTYAEENSCVSAAAAIVRMFRTAIRPYASGKANVSDALLDKLEGVLNAEATYIMGISYPDTYGPLMTSFELSELYRPESNQASVVAKMNCGIPTPYNDGNFYFNLI